MDTQLSCLPCFFKQVIDSSALLGMSEKSAKHISDAVGARLRHHKMEQSPPEMAAFIQSQLVMHTGKSDPYDEIKRKSNAQALSVFGELRSLVAASDHPLQTAVGLACAGNIIDYGVSSHEVDVQAEIEAILRPEEAVIGGGDPALFEIESLHTALKKSRKLLYVGDNAGEIVFDRILMETIRNLFPHLSIHFATRGKPILNDVLVGDAIDCGIDTVATVVSSGVPTPGLALPYASKEFLKLYETFDLVISKGQGNFECLSGTDGPIFFLFITKCPVIMREVGSAMRQIVLMENRRNRLLAD